MLLNLLLLALLVLGHAAPRIHLIIGTSATDTMVVNKTGTQGGPATWTLVLEAHAFSQDSIFYLSIVMDCPVVKTH